MLRTLVLVGLLALAACGDPGSTTTLLSTTSVAGTTLGASGAPADVSDPSPAETTVPEAPDTTIGATADGSVPDACAVMSPGELSDLLGIDIGEGSPMGAASSRSVCFHADGTVTAIEVAANYQLSRDLIDAEGRTTTDIAGIGEAAFFDPAGQVVALGDRYFVAVTAIGVTEEALAQATAALLEAAHASS